MGYEDKEACEACGYRCYEYEQLARCPTCGDVDSEHGLGEVCRKCSADVYEQVDGCPAWQEDRKTVASAIEAAYDRSQEYD